MTYAEAYERYEVAVRKYLNDEITYEEMGETYLAVLEAGRPEAEEK